MGKSAISASPHGDWPKSILIDVRFWELHMRIVVKLGTHTLTDNGDCLSRPRMIDLVRQMADLRNQGHEVLLVSSAAIFAGREVLGPPPRRRDIPYRQVLAAVGQTL